MKTKSMFVIALAAGLASSLPARPPRSPTTGSSVPSSTATFPISVVPPRSRRAPAATSMSAPARSSTTSSSRSWALVEVRKGRWGGLVDFMYLNVGGSETQTRNLTVLGHPLPVGVTANLDLDLKGSIVTLGGEYAAIADPGASVDLVAGARLISVKQTLLWNFSVDLPSGTGPARSGNTEVKADQWDGIVGVKGRLNFGANREWFVPYYLDIGTGESELTWQAIGGIGYAFKWGQVMRRGVTSTTNSSPAPQSKV